MRKLFAVGADEPGEVAVGVLILAHWLTDLWVEHDDECPVVSGSTIAACTCPFVLVEGEAP